MAQREEDDERDYSAYEPREVNYNRSRTEMLSDLHVFVIPLETWKRQQKNPADQLVTDAKSAGYVRVNSESTLSNLRGEISRQIEFQAIPRDFLFLRLIGRYFTQVNSKQENELKAKYFLPPKAYSPELYIIDADSVAESQPTARPTDSLTHHAALPSIGLSARSPDYGDSANNYYDDDGDNDAYDRRQQPNPAMSRAGDDDDSRWGEERDEIEEKKRLKILEEEEELLKRRKMEEEERRRRKIAERIQTPSPPRRLTSSEKDAECMRIVQKLDQLRNRRQDTERLRDRLMKQAKSLQQDYYQKRHDARAAWKKRYFEDKKKTAAKEELLTDLRQKLHECHRKELAQLELAKEAARESVRKGETSPTVVEKANARIHTTKLKNDIENLSAVLQNTKMRLTSEMKLRNQSENELRQLKKDKALSTGSLLNWKDDSIHTSRSTKHNTSKPKHLDKHERPSWLEPQTYRLEKKAPRPNVTVLKEPAQIHRSFDFSSHDDDDEDDDDDDKKIRSHDLPYDDDKKIRSHDLPYDDDKKIRSHDLPYDDDKKIRSHDLPYDDDKKIRSHDLPYDDDKKIRSHDLPYDDDKKIRSHDLPLLKRTPEVCHHCGCNRRSEFEHRHHKVKDRNLFVGDHGGTPCWRCGGHKRRKHAAGKHHGSSGCSECNGKGQGRGRRGCSSCDESDSDDRSWNPSHGRCHDKTGSDSDSSSTCGGCQGSSSDSERPRCGCKWEKKHHGKKDRRKKRGSKDATGRRRRSSTSSKNRKGRDLDQKRDHQPEEDHQHDDHRPNQDPNDHEHQLDQKDRKPEISDHDSKKDHDAEQERREPEPEPYSLEQEPQEKEPERLTKKTTRATPKAPKKPGLPMAKSGSVSNPRGRPYRPGDLDEAFTTFASKADGKEATNGDVVKWCTDAEILGKNLTTQHVDISFSKVKKKGSKTITKRELPALIEQMAVKYKDDKKIDIAQAKRQISEKMANASFLLHGITNAVKAGAVDRLTDTSKYTGMHKTRFDETGKGKGKDGQNNFNGYVTNYKMAGTYDDRH